VFNKALTESLANALVEKKLKLAVAESCTGGMLAQLCTSVSGSSKWFECGFVTYSNVSKTKQLDVQSNVIHEYGAVSAQVAELMALGVLVNSDADISAAITGIAGPGGGSSSKPVGSVYIAIAQNGQKPASKLHLFNGDRHSVREQSAQSAIEQLIIKLSEKD
jgi:nicotinamide-nucleotide amidase